MTETPDIEQAYQAELDNRLSPEVDGVRIPLKGVGERQAVIRKTFQEFFMQGEPETREEIVDSFPQTD